MEHPTQRAIHHNERDQQFEYQEGALKSVLVYRMVGEKLALLHTYVPEPLEGKGIAAALAKTALEYGAANHLRILVYCPYVAAFLQRHVEYQYLVDVPRR